MPFKLYPVNPHKYSCIKEYLPGVDACTYDNFKTYYLNWELSQKETLVTITVPKYIPLCFHKMYLQLELNNRTVYMFNNYPVYHRKWDKLIDDNECYMEFSYDR